MLPKKLCLLIITKQNLEKQPLHDGDILSVNGRIEYKHITKEAIFFTTVCPFMEIMVEMMFGLQHHRNKDCFIKPFYIGVVSKKSCRDKNYYNNNELF
jgi:hypothetical protein